MAPGGEEPERHVVVFDCNIYLDVARLLGPPFSWEKFNAAAARAVNQPVPDLSEPAHDSLRGIAACTSGRFAGEETVEVWTSAHIDKLVRGKAAQSTARDPETGYNGLGWAWEDAQSLVTDLISGTTQRSNGGTVGDHPPVGNPPLDHEDGMVYGACRRLAAEDPLAQVYCVTRDKQFVNAHRQGRLAPHIRVVAPAVFVALIRKSRAQHATRRMRPT